MRLLGWRECCSCLTLSDSQMNNSESRTNTRSDTRLLSHRKAAALLDVSTKTLFRWERAGRLTAVKLDSQATRYFHHELEKLIADAVVGGEGAQ